MQQFDTFGQPAIRRQLDTMLSQARLPHAVLLYGEPGSGILPAALSLARAVLCKTPVEGRPCNACPSCHRSEKLIHPDLHFLLPLAGAKSVSTDYYEAWRETIARNPWLTIFQWTQASEVEGKQLDIHKDDILHSTSRFQLEAYEGGNKVMIIWMAQFLAKEGNRLLKMIEEPQPGTYFILVSNQRDYILPTIRSRCQQIFFPPIQTAEIESLLTTHYNVPPEKAALIAAQSGHDMNSALSLMENTVLNFLDEMTQWFRSLLGRRHHELIQWSTRMGTEEKEEQKQFALYVISFIRNMLWSSVTSGNDNAHPQGDMMRFLHQHFSPDSWHRVIEELQTGHDKIQRNANTKLLWLAVSLTIKNHLAVHRLQHINA